MRPSSLVSLSALVLLFVGPLAGAAAQRTFVSLTGNDAHACSISQPCRTFSAAIAQTTVTGEVIVLESGGYGPVTIGKSVSIIAPPGIYAGVSVPSGDGITVSATGGTVVLRGLTINGQGGNNGVYISQVARLRIEGCTISNMGAHGVVNFASGSDMVVVDTIVRDNLGTGIRIATNSSVVLDHVRIEHNAAHGFYIVSSGSEATATIADSLFVNNGANGIWADTVAGGTTQIQVERTTMSKNGAAGFVATASLAGASVDATLARNAIQSNGGQGVLISAVTPGRVNGLLNDNNILAVQDDGIFAHGSGAHVQASGNIVLSSGGLATALNCDAGSSFLSFGNNNADSVTLAACMTSSFKGF